jgi:hypothetical protein
MVAEWWTRAPTSKILVRLSNGTVIDQSRLSEPQFAAEFELGSLRVDESHRPRRVKAWKVRQRILTGAELLEETDWKGRFIPIVPVWGDEVNLEGRRHFRSLIRDAKDAQRMFNYWRTTSTELVALAPRVPFIGPKGSFTTDAEKWATINTQSHAFVEYDDKGTPPQRQPLGSGPAGGALQEAMNASDDMKAIIGLFDASLGAKSNETSGRAILARMREGDISTFHFVDNMARAIRHTGRILLDLIPHVYSEARIVRVIGEDGDQRATPINQEAPVIGPDGKPAVDKDGRAVTRMHDIRVGKYDLTVTTGPSFTTRREEAAVQMTDMIRAFPQIAPVIGDLVAKHLDWPGADEIAKRLRAMAPDAKSEIPAPLQKLIADGQKLIQQLQAENAKLKTDTALAAKKLEIEQFKAETERLTALADVQAKAGGPPRPNGGQGPIPAPIAPRAPFA